MSTESGQVRVRWRERQPVGHRDLTVEQESHLQLRRRHDRGSHRWGVVTGLELSAAADRFLVAPGAAVDGYGRGLVLPAPIAIPVEIVNELITRLNAKAVDVWLLYARAPVTPPQPGRYACGHGRNSRWSDTPRARLTAVCDPTAGLREVASLPHLPAPDDDRLEWPVPLGRIFGGQVGDGHRRLAGLVGEQIVSPLGDARFQVGTERPGDPHRFAVATGAPLVDRITVDRRGAVALRGDTTLGGRLRLGPVEVLPPAKPVASALRFRTLTEVPEAPAPWTVSRVATDRDTLRVEIGNPGAQGDPAQHRFVVGVPGADPLLTVQATGAVTLHANALTVEGLVVQGPAKPDPADPRVARAMIGKWLTGLLQAGGELLGTGLGLTISGVPAGPVGVGEALGYTVTVRNTGTEIVNAVTVVDAFTVDGTPVLGEGGLALQAATLAPGATADSGDREVDAPPNPGATLMFLVVATGTTPSGRLVLAATTASVAIAGGDPL